MGEEKILQVVLRAKDQVSRVLDKVGSNIDKSASKLDRLASISRKAGAVITGASVGMAVGIAKMAESGGRLIDVERSFNSLAKNAGRSSKELLTAFREATAGTVDSATMMKNAVRASMLGIPVDKMTTLMKIARQQAVAMGEDMNYMLESIVTGIGRASPLILDNLGITIKMGEVYEEAAKKLGKKADELTEAERKQALLNAVIEWGAQKEKELGGQVESASDAYMRFRANIADLFNEFKKALNPAVAEAANYVSALTNKLREINPETLRLAARVVAVGTAVGLVVGPILFLIGMLVKLKGVFTTTFVGLKAVGAFLWGWPGIILLVAAAVAGLAYLIWRNKEKIVGAFEAMSNKVREWADGIAKWIGKVRDTINRIGDIFVGLYDLIVRGDFTGALGRALGVDEDSPLIMGILNFRQTVIDVFNSVANVVMAIVNRIIAIGTTLFYIFRAIAAVVLGVLALIFAGVFNFMSALLSVVVVPILTAIYQFFVFIFNGIKDLVNLAWSGILMITSFVWNTIFGGIIVPILQAIWSFIQFIFSAIHSFVKWIWDSVYGATVAILNAVFGFVKGIFEKVYGFIASKMSAVYSVLKSYWDMAMNYVKSRVSEGMDYVVNKINSAKNSIFSAAVSIWKKFQEMANKIMGALRSIKFPHLSIGEGVVNVAGHEIKYPKINVDWYQKGGWVKRTGLAVVHAGEYVLSKDMLAGRQPVDRRVFNQPVTVYAEVAADIDIDYLAYKLGYLLRNR